MNCISRDEELFTRSNSDSEELVTDSNSDSKRTASIVPAPRADTELSHPYRGQRYLVGQISAATAMWQIVDLSLVYDALLIDKQTIRFNFLAWIGWIEF